MDKKCEAPHDHDSIIIVTVPLLNDEFVDFKTVKLATETVLAKMMGKNITDLYGLGMTEQLVEYLANHIGEALDKRIDVYIQETSKYGMEYVSD